MKNEEVQELKRELSQLKKLVAKLEAQLSKMAPPNDITCTSLTVVSPLGIPVAKIDGTGFLKCTGASVSSGVNPRGVLLDGQSGAVNCLKFALWNRTSNTELVSMSSSTGSPTVTLRGEREAASSVRLEAFKGQGGVIAVTDNRGRDGVQLTSSADTSAVTVANRKNGQGQVLLRASYIQGGDGAIFTQDRHGVTTGQLPNRETEGAPAVTTAAKSPKKAARSKTK